MVEERSDRGESGIAGARVKCIGLPDQFVEHGSREELCSAFRLDAVGIVGHILDFFPDLVRPSLSGEVKGSRIPSRPGKL